MESKVELLNDLQDRVGGLIIKNLQISTRNEIAYAWITFSPETTFLTPRTMAQLMGIVDVIQTHASVCWEYDDEELEEIEMTKCDVAVDLRGAFLPVDDGRAF